MEEAEKLYPARAKSCAECIHFVRGYGEFMDWKKQFEDVDLDKARIGYEAVAERRQYCCCYNYTVNGQGKPCEE